MTRERQMVLQLALLLRMVCTDMDSISVSTEHVAKP